MLTGVCIPNADVKAILLTLLSFWINAVNCDNPVGIKDVQRSSGLWCRLLRGHLVQLWAPEVPQYGDWLCKLQLGPYGVGLTGSHVTKSLSDFLLKVFYQKNPQFLELQEKIDWDAGSLPLCKEGLELGVITLDFVVVIEVSIFLMIFVIIGSIYVVQL